MYVSFYRRKCKLTKLKHYIKLLFTTLTNMETIIFFLTLGIFLSLNYNIDFQFLNDYFAITWYSTSSFSVSQLLKLELFDFQNDLNLSTIRENNFKDARWLSRKYKQ